MTDVEPRFKPVFRVAIKRKLNDLYQEGRDEMLKKISVIKPTVTVDFWTGRDGHSLHEIKIQSR